MKTFTEARTMLMFVRLFLGLAASAPVVGIAADRRVPADYPTIQAAVNAAQTDDTIHIAAGIYTGQVLIVSKTLTLIGQPGTILRATTSMPIFPGSPYIPLMGIRLSTVTIQGMTFEGERLAGRLASPYDLLGIYLRQSSATVENCSFFGFRENVPGQKLAGAIGVFNTENNAAMVTLRVAGSMFADNYNGLYFIGSPTRKSIDVTVENNTIIGPGPLNTVDSIIGILFREGAGGRIVGNTVSGYAYIGSGADSPISLGVLADSEANYPSFDQTEPALIEGNTFRDNQYHVALIRADNSVVSNNHFQGTAPGITPVALALTGTNVTITKNRFENLPEGIRLIGTDPISGNILGKAVDAHVRDNRFCDVTTPLTLQPLASGTQEGTLTCPFSPPELAIAPTLLLSWPGDEDGWTVESSPGLDSPWAPTDVPIFTQGGRHNLAVPIDGERRLFRLRPQDTKP